MSYYATYPHLVVPSRSNRASSSSSSTATNTRLNATTAPGPSDSTGSLGIGAKLRDIFDMQKFALFDVEVTIHEVGNVPQLQGEFSAHYKFKGGRPKARDSLGPSRQTASAKPSLPNLKLTQAHPSLIDKDSKSISSVSLRSTSTGGSSTTSGTTGYSQAMKGKSMSTPPLAFGGMPNGIHRMVEKKGSDPTPLRNSVKLEQEHEEGNGVEIVESPTATTALQIPDLGHGDDKDGEGEETPGKSALTSTAMTAGPGLASSSSSLLPPSTIASTSSASSSTSYLAVPMPKSGTPSQATTMERSVSGQTNSGRSIKSHSAMGGSGSDLHRSRSNSNPNTGPHASTSKSKLSNRVGTTPHRSLKSHTCVWDEKLHLYLRFPITKDRDKMEAAGYKSKAPMLGEGSDSGSGLRLEVYQHSVSPITSHSKTDVGTEDADEKEKTRAPMFKHGHRGKSTMVGEIDIDLAPFASKGRTSRKYLLKESKSNATIQITVDMVWIGGDRNWVAPPLIEGHHLSTRLRDVVGRDASDALQRDLQLMQTPSQSSSGSSMTHAQSILSHNLSSNVSSSHYQYKSYEHHLLSPDDARLRTPAATNNTEDNHKTPTMDDFTPNTPGREGDETEASNSPQTPTATPRSARTFWNNHRPGRHHHHSPHHFRNRLDHAGSTRKTHGITEMDANYIIDNILNPHPGTEDGPFTFIPPIPEPEPEPELELRGEAEHHERSPDDLPTNHSRPKLAWRRKKTERKDTVSSVVNMGRVVSSTGVGAGASRGTSPVRLPRSGSTNAIHA